MFSGRETVAGPGGAASGSDQPQPRMEFVLLSGSKQPHYPLKRLEGSAEPAGLQDAGIAHLGLPTCEHRPAGDEYVCTRQPGKTEAWTLPLVQTYGKRDLFHRC